MHDRWQALFANYLNTSFVDVLRHHTPEILPGPWATAMSPEIGEARGRSGVPTGTRPNSVHLPSP